MKNRNGTMAWTARLGLAVAGILASSILAAAAPAAEPAEQAFKARSTAQIAALEKEKAARTPAQKKMDSQLVYAVKQGRKEAVAPGVASLHHAVKFQPDGRVLVDVKAKVTPALLKQIADLGGIVLTSYPRWNAVRASVPLDKIEKLAGLPDVKFVRPPPKAAHNTGSVDSEGDATHLAAAARAAFGVNGTGVKVGVLSDGVDHLAHSHSTGDLGTVTILPGQAGSGDEGTALLEIIHDLAPGAQLYFATGDNSEASMAQNILDLKAAGCNIICDDLTYPDESPFQDGVIAQAVNTVSAGGVLYFSAAGNDGNEDSSGQACTWEGDFLDGGAINIDGESGRVHNFGGGIKYDATTSYTDDLAVSLFWSDPLGGSSNEYDLFLTDSTGNVLAASTNIEDGTEDPYQSLEYFFVDAGSRLVIVQCPGAAGRFLHLDTSGVPLDITTAGNVQGHNASEAANAFCVAATPAAVAFDIGYPTGPYPNPFNSSCEIEPYTSDGPRRMFYKPDGTPYTPGNFSSTGGTVFQKPDFTAADGVTTSMTADITGDEGFAPFFGTSAATPHAAAIAALLKSANPSFTPAQIRTALTSTAIEIGTPGWDRDSGAGIVMADKALVYKALSVQSTPPTGLSIGSTTGHAGTTNYLVAGVSTGTNVNLQAPATDPTGYIFSQWTVNGAAQTAGQKSITFMTSSSAGTIAVAQYTGATLYVQSTPPVGLSITSSTGDAGTTNYSVSQIAFGSSVNLSAPATDSSGLYGFSQWTLNGVAQTAGQKSITFAISADTTAVAQYASVTLYVQSAPPTGLIIGSSTAQGGKTNYTLPSVALGASVNLRAPATDPAGSAFLEWTLNGAAQTAGQKSITFKISADTTAVAQYTSDTLSVQSAPPTGVGITSTTGDGGTTNYSVTGIASGASLNLSAPATDPTGCTFSQWTLNGVAQTAGQKAVTFPAPASFHAWGSAGAGNGQFDYPTGIAADSAGNVYVSDMYNYRIQKFTASGAYVTQWGSAGSGNGQFNLARLIALDSAGNVYAADEYNNRIQKFTSTGVYVAKWGSHGSGNGQFAYPMGVAVAGDGNVYVADESNNRIQKFTSTGAYLAQWGGSGSGNGQFDLPQGVAVDSAGNVYVSDTVNNRIQKFTSVGAYQAQWGGSGSGNGQFDFPTGMAFDSAGNIYVADRGNNRIQEFTSAGAYLAQWGALGAGNGQFNTPEGIAVSSLGNVYVTDYYNNRVEAFAQNILAVAQYTVKPSNTLTVQSTPPTGIAISSSTADDGTTDYTVPSIASGTNVNLVAPETDPTGYTFSQWTVNGTAQTSGKSITFAMSAATTAVAQYTLNICALTVQSTPLTGLSITSVAGYGGTTNCTFTGIVSGTSVDLTAPATDPTGFTFSDWTVNGTAQTAGLKTIAFTVTSGTTVVAQYTLNSGTLIVQSTPVAGLSITSVAGCGGTTNYTFTGIASGTSVDLTAPATDSTGAYTFLEWTLNGVPQNPGKNAITFPMTTGTTAVAEYITCTLNVQSTPPAGLSIVSSTGDAGATNYTVLGITSGTSVNLQAPVTDPDGYYFTQWAVNGMAQTAGQKSITFVAPASYQTWGSDGAGNGQFDYPRGVAVDASGNVYVADTFNYRIQKFSSAGAYVTKWGSSGSGNGQFEQPTGIAIDSAGNVYVADSENFRVQKFTSTGAYLTKWGSAGSEEGQFNLPYGIAIDTAGNVYVVDTGNSRVQKFTTAGAYVTQWGTSGSGNGQFDFPYGIAVDSLGNVYVADTHNNRIQKFTSSGAYVTQWGGEGVGNGQLEQPFSIAVDSLGNVYVTDYFNYRIQEFISTSVYITQWGGLGSGNGQFHAPWGLAVDIAGNVYVADYVNECVQVFRQNLLAVAQYTPGFTLAVQSTLPTGVGISSSTGDAGTTNYTVPGVAYGTSVNLIAPATNPAGYTFSQWTVNGAAQTAGLKTITFTVTAVTTAIAQYTANIYTLTVQSTPPTGIAIASSTGCGGTTNYTAPVAYNSSVTLTAPAFDPSGTYSFSAWTLNGAAQTAGQQTITFPMPVAATATAQYVPNYALTVQSTPPTGLSICSCAGCSGTTNYMVSSIGLGTSVNLVAPATDPTGYTFSHWMVNGTAQTAGLKSITFTMTAATTSVAQYTLDPSALLVQSTPPLGLEIGSSTGDAGTTNYMVAGVTSGASVNLVAPANDPPGYAFAQWAVNGVAQSAGVKSVTFPAPAGFLQWGSYGTGNGQFRIPAAIARDNLGNVYVADQENSRVQKFTSAGAFITKWGGHGTGNGQFLGPSGIAVDAEGNVYVADGYNNNIQKFTSAGVYMTQWGGSGAGNGQLSAPYGIAFDSLGYVYVADSNNFRVQKFDSTGAYVAQWGSQGGGDGQFEYSYGIAIDSLDNVYVADESNFRIQKFTTTGAYVAQWGSEGGGNGQFEFPQGIAVDDFGNVYVADSLNNRIQEFTSGGVYITQWGSLGAGPGQFYQPAGVAVDGPGNVIYVADTANERVEVLSQNILAVAQYTAAPATLIVQSTPPTGLGVGSSTGDAGTTDYSVTGLLPGQTVDLQAPPTDPAGYTFVEWMLNGVALTAGQKEVAFTAPAGYLTWGGSGGGDGQFNEPLGVALDSANNVYVVDSANYRIEKFDSNGNFLAQWGGMGSGNGQFNLPIGIATDAAANVYVADWDNNNVQKFTSAGVYVAQWGGQGGGNGQFNEAAGVAVDNLGNVYVVDSGNNRIQKFTSAGAYVTQWGGLGSGNGHFNGPHFIAADAAGNIYVADSQNFRVQKFTPAGVYVTQWGGFGGGNGQFVSPYGIAADALGNVYVGDTYNLRIQKFTSAGAYVSQWGSAGGGNGQFNNPSGIVADAAGNVYVADYVNDCVQVFRQNLLAVAQYAANATLTVQSTPVTGLSIGSTTGDAGTTNYTVPNIAYGTGVDLQAPAADPGGLFTFAQWTLNGVAQTSGVQEITFTMTAATTAVAQYAPDPGTLAVQSTDILGNPLPGISIAGTYPGTTNYAVGGIASDTSVSLTAPAADPTGDYLFTQWTLNGSVATPGQTLAFTMTTGTLAVAQYTLNTFALTVQSTPPTGLSIASSTGMAGTTNYAVPGIASGTSVNLQAPATDPSGYAFLQWTVNGTARTLGQKSITFALAADTTAAAQYAPFITVLSQNPATGVTIAISPPDIIGLGNMTTGIAPNTRTYYPGTSVTLTAQQAASGNNFQKWQKDGSDFSASPAITVTAGPDTYTAVYLTPTAAYTLVVQSTPPTGLGIASSSGHNGTTNYTKTGVGNATVVNLVAPAADPAGYVFLEWTVNGAAQSPGQKTITFTMAANTTAVAHYGLNSGYTLVVQSTPPTGIVMSSSTGQGGKTNYTVSGITQGTIVSLQAPGTDPIGFAFSQWVVNGAAQSPGQKSVTFAMGSAVTAVAHYTANVGFLLSVQSTPPTGLAITSSTGYGGTTNYTKAGVAGGAIVELAAPATDPANYTFSQWVVNGAVQPAGLKSVTFAMDSAVTAVARYTLNVGYTLTVQSTPPTKLSIGSSAGYGGTTSYTVTGVGYGAGVNLQAPATDPANYTFSEWTLNGAAQNAGQKSVTFPMDSAVTAVAHYTLNTVYVLAVQSTPPAGMAIGSATGNNGTTNYTNTLAYGTVVNLVAPANDPANFTFSQWTVNGAAQAPGQKAISFVMGAAVTAVAHYTANIGYALVVQSAPPGGLGIGSSTGDAGTTNYTKSGLAAGTNVSLAAPANDPAGYVFTQWTVNGASQAPGQKAISFAMDSAVTAVARYTANAGYSLTVQSAPAGGIAIGSSTGDAGTTNYLKSNVPGGTGVELTAPATATVGGVTYAFSQWTVNGAAQAPGQQAITFTLNGATTAVAQYTRSGQTLTVESTPPTGLSIGSSTGQKGTTNYYWSVANGAGVNLAAPANDPAGYTFSGWTLNGTAQTPGQKAITFTMSGTTVAVAQYTLNGYTLTVQSTPLAAVVIGSSTAHNGTTSYSVPNIAYGTGVELAAPAADPSGYAFSQWTLNGAPQTAGQKAISFTMVAAVTAVAQYAANVVSTLTVQSTPPTGLVMTSGTGHNGTTNYSVPGISYGTSVNLAAPGTDASGLYAFTQWTVNNAAQPAGQQAISFPMAAAATAVAHYALNSGYALTVQSTPPAAVVIGSATGHNGTTNYAVPGIAYSTSVNLQAPAADPVGYSFVQWTVNGAAQPAGQKSVTFTMNAAVTAAARYIANTGYALTVQSTPPAGVVIGSSTGQGGTTSYAKSGVPNGAAIVLTAPAADPAGYSFAQWTVNGAAQPAGQKTISFTMNAAVTAAAQYTANAGYALTVQSTPPVAQLIGSSTGHNGTTNYAIPGIAYGTVVNLQAPAADPPGYTFSQWTLNGAAQSAGQKAITFTMDAAVTAAAQYSEVKRVKAL